MSDNDYSNRMIIDLPRTEENMKFYIPHIDMEKEEELLKKEQRKFQKNNTI